MNDVNAVIDGFNIKNGRSLGGYGGGAFSATMELSRIVLLRTTQPQMAAVLHLIIQVWLLIVLSETTRLIGAVV